MAAEPAGPGAGLVDRLTAPFLRFFAIEAASTLALLFATVVALAWANSPWGSSYAYFWHSRAGFGLGPLQLSLTLEHWVNDGLMVLFFFLVGMEIKHELVHGELATRERAMLPVVGALGGMVAPAAIYASLHPGGPAAAGWGVPMATDIAFAVAALAVFGRRVPSGLKVFLLALAIVDDLGAVTVIALFYTHGLSFPALAGAGVLLAFMLGLRFAGVRVLAVYWMLGIAVWYCVLQSGVHATVAGVLLGLATPTRIGGRADEDATFPLKQLARVLHPWSAWLVMPIFALANAGVVIEGRALGDPLATRVALGVALGLVVGKPVGITLFCWLAVRAGLAALPQGVGWGSLAGVGILGGVGFTMALFITALAFADPMLVHASKAGVIVASVLAAALGIACLARTLPHD